MADLISLIKNPIAQVFRRAYIKRRSDVTGLFEDDFLEVSKFVKKWGSVSLALDATRPYKFTFGNSKLVFENEGGEFNPHTDSSSFWYGYLNQQRTLVRIDAGYIDRNFASSGHWTNVELPAGATWDLGTWETAIWDDEAGAAIFHGIVSGDINLSDQNEVTLNIKPLVSVFQDFAAANLTGFTSTGMTASQFIGILRDQTDGSGSFVFRPFFGNTTTNWDISTTSNIFTNLNTSSAQDVINSTVWEVVEKLAEAENFVPYITRKGIFRFVSRDVNTSTSQFDFYGNGFFNTEHGHTIKKISSYGPKISKYYSRVEVKFRDASTATSYEVFESHFEVSPNNNPWVLGHRTLKLENVFIQTSTVANTIAQNIFEDVSSLKNEVSFTTTFIPQLDILDRTRIYYDPSQVVRSSFWDLNEWADDATNTSSDLIFDPTRAESILLEGREFKFLSLNIDLDNFENSFVAREV